MSAYIGPESLVPGQWILFETNTLSEDKKGPHKVISRLDAAFDPCCCNLMDFEGKLSYYCPRMMNLSLQQLGNYKIQLIKSEEISNLLGTKAAQVQVENQAFAHLARLAKCKYFGKGYHPIGDGPSLKASQIKEWFDMLSGFKHLHLAKLDKNCSMEVFLPEIFNLIAKQLVNSHNIPLSLKK